MPEQIGTDLTDLLMQAETATIGHTRLYGFCDRRIAPLSGRPRIAGTAVTIAIPGPDSTLLHHVAGMLRPGDILVVDRLGDDTYACWGGSVTVAVKAAGAVGGIVDGPVTDIVEVEDSGLPLFCRGLAPITTRLYDLGGRINYPVSIGGVVVMPGDAILADDSGVLVMPAAEAEVEARRAIAKQQASELLQDKVRAGAATLGTLSGASAKVYASLV